MSRCFEPPSRIASAAGVATGGRAHSNKSPDHGEVARAMHDARARDLAQGITNPKLHKRHMNAARVKVKRELAEKRFWEAEQRATMAKRAPDAG